MQPLETGHISRGSLIQGDFNIHNQLNFKNRSSIYLLGVASPDLGVPALPGLGIDLRGVGKPLRCGETPLTCGCFKPLTLGDDGRGKEFWGKRLETKT